MYIYTLHAYSLLIKRSLFDAAWTLEKASEEKKNVILDVLKSFFVSV